MAQLVKYDLDGNQMEEVAFPLSPRKAISSRAIRDYLVILRKNRRQWSANTKGRSEIRHSNAKPRPQKGSGGARQGTIKAPQYRGGAAVFGPKPKFAQSRRVNRKERRAAIRALFGEKIANGHLHLFELDMVQAMETPKTKRIVALLKRGGLQGKSVLFLEGDSDRAIEGWENFALSFRNIPRVRLMPLRIASGLDVIGHQEIVIIGSAYEQLVAMMGGGHEEKHAV